MLMHPDISSRMEKPSISIGPMNGYFLRYSLPTFHLNIEMLFTSRALSQH